MDTNKNKSQVTRKKQKNKKNKKIKMESVMNQVSMSGIPWLSIVYKIYLAVIIILIVYAIIMCIYDSLTTGYLSPQTSSPAVNPLVTQNNVPVIKELKPAPFVVYDLGERMFIGVKRVRGLLTCQYTKNRKEAAKFVENQGENFSTEPIVFQHVSSSFYMYVEPRGSIFYPAYIEDTTIGWIKLPVNKRVGYSKSDFHMERVKYDLIDSLQKDKEKDDIQSRLEEIEVDDKRNDKREKYLKKIEKATRKLNQFHSATNKDTDELVSEME